MELIEAKKLTTTPLILTLPEQIKIEWLKVLLEYIGGFQTNSDLRKFLVESRQLAVRYLPIEIQMYIDDFRQNRISPPYLLIKNLPTDDVTQIKTPDDGFLSKVKRTLVTELVQMGLAELLGIPYAFENERRNAGYIHLIAARKGEKDTSETPNLLDWHVENAFSPNSLLRPSYVTLICLRPDPEKKAITRMVDIRDLIPNLSLKSLEILSRPIFVFRLPNSFGATSSVSNPMPIIGGHFDDPEFSLTQAGKILVVAADADLVSAGYAALEELSLLMEQVELQHEVRLTTGDFLIINNYRTAHSRTEYDLHDHGYNRWLHRVLVRPSLFEARKMKGQLHNQFI